MSVSKYNDLIVWQKSMDLVLKAYQVIKSLPNDERFALADQMRRSVISVPSNIAEGAERNGSKEFIHFLGVAKGSLAEFMTQLELCIKLNYFNDVKEIFDLGNEVGKMISSLIAKLTTNN